MAKIYGQIESLRRVRETLDRHGIERFGSIADINDFVKNYDNEINTIKWEVEEEIANKLEDLASKRNDLEETHQKIYQGALKDFESKRLRLEHEVKEAKAWEVINFVFAFFKWVRIHYYKGLLYLLERNQNDTIGKKVLYVTQQLKTVELETGRLTNDKENIIDQRCKTKLGRLAHIRDVVTEINPIIAGAIGESKVQKEIEKLPDNYILINDLSLKFDTPIYNRKTKDKIFSIQVDHLLVSQAGLFILETKNWSKQSVENLDLRSPVKQIQRTSYAFFVILNGADDENLGLKQHHWGKKQVPIRNVIVMINEKPRDSFKFVTIKSLWELNKYITYFDPIFDQTEVERIAQHILKMKEKPNVLSQPLMTINENHSMKPKASSKASMYNWLKDNPGKGINDYYKGIGR